MVQGAKGLPIRHWLPKPVAATLVVSASDTVHPERADYHCDGTNDEVEINAALAAIVALGVGGCVELLEGTYNIANPITFPGNSLILKGQGVGTFIDGDGLATTEHGIVISGRTDCRVEDLSIQTEDGGGKTCHCIFIEDGADRTRISRITIVDSDTDGIHVEGTNIYDLVIEGCISRDTDDHGIFFQMDTDNSIWDLSIINNTILSAGAEGVEFVAPGGTGHYYRVLIQGNQFFTSGNDGLEAVDIQRGVIDSNLSNYNMMHGIQVTNCLYVVVSNNSCLNNSQDGIEFDGTTAQCSAVGNICVANGGAGNYAGIDLGQVSDCLVEGNFCYYNQRFGIILGVGGGGRNACVGNHVFQNYRHGIYCAGTDLLVEDNYVYNNSQETAGTYHGIYLDNNCFRCVVSGNQCIDDGTAQEDGIHLVDGVDECQINNNYCYNNMGSGIALTDNNVDCQIVGNYCQENDDYGIELTASGVTRAYVKENKLVGNVTGQFLDNGTDTQTPFVFVPVPNPNSYIGRHPSEILTDGIEMLSRIELYVPLEFQELVMLEAVVVALGTGNMRTSVASNYGKICSGEDYNQSSASIAEYNEPVTINDLECVNISGAVAGIAAGDLAGIEFVRHADDALDTVDADVHFLGIRMRYV